MTCCTYLRALRLRHGISLEELAAAAGVSKQCVSRVELGQSSPTRGLEEKYERAMEELIAARYAATRALEREYRMAKQRLFEKVEDADDAI